MQIFRLTFAAALVAGALSVPALAADDSTTPAPAPSSTDTATPAPAPSGGTATPAPAPATTDSTTPPTDDKSGKDAKGGDDKPKPTGGGY